MSRIKNRKMRKRKWITIPLISLLLLGLIIGGYFLFIYYNAKTTVNDKMFEPVQSIDTNVTKKKIKASEPLHILLLGIDAETGDKGRSDALMILSLDPKKETMQLISIPRDTRTMIVGKGFEDKINHAYSFGGVDMAIATVENFLDIELDYYVRINMQGLKHLVDHLGTIQVYNEIAWSDGKYDFPMGPLDMDGDQTMHFVRMRKQDPAGDFGRTKRQRQVIAGIVDRGASVASVSKIDGVIKILGNNMATNLDFDDMKRLLFDYSNTRKNFVDYQMQGTGAMIDNIYYLIVDDAEIQKVKGMLENIGS